MSDVHKVFLTTDKLGAEISIYAETDQGKYTGTYCVIATLGDEPMGTLAYPMTGAGLTVTEALDDLYAKLREAVG